MTPGVATIVVASGSRAGERFELHGELIVGREGADITIPDDAEASRRHAAFRPVPGGVEVVDLDSRNGTTVDGERVAGSSAAGDGSVVEVGNTRFKVETALIDVAATRQSPIVTRSEQTAVRQEPDFQPTVAHQQQPPPPAAPEPSAAAEETTAEEPPPAEPQAPPAPVRIVMGFIFGAGPEKIKFRMLGVVLTWTLVVAAITVLIYTLVG